MSTILFHPEPEWRYKFVSGGPCGARPPLLYFEARTGTFTLAKSPEVVWSNQYPSDADWCGLVLAFNDEPVREGLDHWWRVGREIDPRWPYAHPALWATFEEIKLINTRGLGALRVIPWKLGGPS